MLSFQYIKYFGLSYADYDEYERSMLISQTSFEKTFGLSSVFIESTLMENGGVAESSNPSTLIKEAIHVISCGYEEKTAWGKEVGFCSTLCKTNGWDSCSFTKTSVNIILEDIISCKLEQCVAF